MEQNRKRTTEEMEKAVETILIGLGEDTDREGLKETPKRYVKFLKQFMNPEPFEMTTFANENDSDEMIIVKDIPFFSLCEHHLAPFFGVAHVAYIPNDKIVGLSKIPRTVDKFANKPQNQERITKEVAEYLMDKLDAKGVAVVLKARHMCVEMRGVKKHSCETVTSKMVGCFYDELNCRQEFLNLISK